MTPARRQWRAQHPPGRKAPAPASAAHSFASALVCPFRLLMAAVAAAAATSARIYFSCIIMLAGTRVAVAGSGVRARACTLLLCHRPSNNSATFAPSSSFIRFYFDAVAAIIGADAATAIDAHQRGSARAVCNARRRSSPILVDIFSPLSLSSWPQPPAAMRARARSLATLRLSSCMRAQSTSASFGDVAVCARARSCSRLLDSPQIELRAP